MYRKTVLDNGIRILSEQMENYRSVSLGIWVDVGSRDESEEESGVSHFIEHMLFKGTRNRSALDIAKELDAIGGMSNAFTGKEYTCFHAKVLDRHFPILVDILSDILLHSVLDPHDIEKERHVILQEISMVEDTPDDYIHVLFTRNFWMNHPLGRSVLGSTKTVSSMGRECILRFMDRFYRPERILVTAAGNIEHDTLVSAFRPLLESLEEGGDPSSRSKPRITGGVSCLTKDLEQVHVCIGGKAPDLASERRYAGALLNTILGGNMSSRLFQEIREKRGLAYSVYSFLSPYIDTGLLGIYVATDPASLNEVLALVHGEVKKILDGDITPEDLGSAREHLVGGILLGAENTDTRMMRLAKNEFVFGRFVDYDEVLSDLERVTVEEVVSVAREAFGDEGVSLTTLGPLREEDVDLNYLKFSG